MFLQRLETYLYIFSFKEIISGLKCNRKSPAELRTQNVLKQQYKKLGSMRYRMYLIQNFR